MVTFILAAILIVLATLAFLVWPLLFTRNTFSYARHAQNIHYAKERLAELEEQLKNATISATDYEALKLEIESTLAEDIDLANSESSENTVLPRRPNKAAISSLVVLIPLSAAVVYHYVGNTQSFDITAQASAAEPQSPHAGNQQPSPAEINQMVVNLEQRLKENPEDIQGWALLSRTYLALGQYGKARNGLLEVLELGGESADIYASLADATALAAGGDMRGEALRYADRALALNPRNRQALWLRGLAAVQLGDNSLAEKHWGTLLTMLDDQPEQKAELQSIMADALGTPLENTSVASVTEAKTGLSESSTAGENGVYLLIDIAPSVKASSSPQDVVYVFARAENGPPPPLAVRRLRVADLPAEIVLSDNDAMVPQFKMSLFPNILVSARLSKSGQPVASAGDIESEKVATVPTQGDQISLLIETVVE